MPIEIKRNKKITALKSSPQSENRDFDIPKMTGKKSSESEGNRGKPRRELSPQYKHLYNLQIAKSVNYNPCVISKPSIILIYDIPFQGKKKFLFPTCALNNRGKGIKGKREEERKQGSDCCCLKRGKFAQQSIFPRKRVICQVFWYHYSALCLLEKLR